jgi:hypothetical protein
MTLEREAVLTVSRKSGGIATAPHGAAEAVVYR